MNKHILIATDDMYLRSSLTAILSQISHYHLQFAVDFDVALDTILKNKIDLVLVHQTLGGLSGMDLIAVVGRVKPCVPFILFDDDISARTAMAAFRLGARDYMTYPPKPHLLLMQIDRCFGKQDIEETQEARKVSDKAVDYASLLDPEQRAVALALNREQHQALHYQLRQIAEHTRATFVGILDSGDNIVDAIGNFSTFDIRKLKQVVEIDTKSYEKLTVIPGIDRFTATFREGDLHHVYMLKLLQDKATLVAVSPSSVKAGAVWLHLKRSAKEIVEILGQHPGSRIHPIFT